MTALVWFRRDLRLADNPAWAAATRAHDAVQAMVVLDDTLLAAAGEARRDLFFGHLAALDRQLQEAGGRLLVIDGDPTEEVPKLARRHDGVYWNADYTPYARSRDDAVAAAVDGHEIHHGTVVHPPGSVLTGDGEPYRVFTPFYRRWSTTETESWPSQNRSVQVLDASEVGLEVPAGLEAADLGEAGAEARLGEFMDRVDQYDDRRNDLSPPATSRLSADLKFGTISPRRIVDAVGTEGEGREAFVRQVAWRDFHTHALAAFPHGYDESLRDEYRDILWRSDDDGLAAWQEGRTGYPIVDAGMRELLATGWMHNRLRMITASFLVKDLLIDWRLGERHFRHHLIDGDRSQNAGNWQWVAGTGFDAAPYFRVMNPVTQGRRHDPDGDHIRQWVPELASLQGAALHEPWEHPDALEKAGVVLGRDYPSPIVDHQEARRRTIDAYERARASAG